MMNPDYEKQSDINNEQRVLEAISQRYGVEVAKCPPYYPFDGVVIKDGKVDSMIEFKHRNFASNKFPTSFIGLNKVLSAHNIRAATGIPCNLVVEWEDMIGMINIRNFCKVAVGGRKDRNDPNDYQLVAHYRIEDFKRLDLF